MTKEAKEILENILLFLLIDLYFIVIRLGF